MARYKVLKSVAHSMGASFASLMNDEGNDPVMSHLLRRAREVGEPSLSIDLIAGSAGPAALLVPAIITSVDNYCRWFPHQLTAHKTDRRYVSAAHLTVTFDLGVERPARASDRMESPYVCHVEVTDDRGSVWSAEISGWWW